MIHYTTIEQSKHLIELGLSPASADKEYDAFNQDPYPQVIRHQLSDKHWEQLYPKIFIPCWSLGALLEVMPKIPMVEYNLVLPGIEEGTPYVAFDDCRETYMIHEDFEGSTPLEAAYNTICWLLEQGYIKKEV